MRAFIFHTIAPAILLALLTAISPHLYAADVLTAEFPQDLSSVRVSLCFDGEASDRIYRSSQARQWSNGIYFNQQQLQTREDDGSVRLPALPENSCLKWQVDLNSALRHSDRRAMTQLDGALIMNADVWFWRGTRGRDLVVQLKLPEGFAFSTPWKEIGQKDNFTLYQPDDTPPRWESKLAIGEFNIQPIDIPGAQLRMATPGNITAAEQQK